VWEALAMRCAEQKLDLETGQMFPSLLALLGLSGSFVLVTLTNHCCSEGSGVNSWYVDWPSAPKCLEGALIRMLCGIFTLGCV